MGWVEIEDYQQVLKDIQQFLNASINHRIIGMQLLGVIILDINSATIPRYSATFRKAASGFRDTQLLDIFKMAYDTLKNLLDHTIRFDNPGQENRLCEYTLQVLINCLSYDFAGTSIDESGEDIGTVQVPTSWRSIYEQEGFLNTFFQAYQEFSPPHTSKLMECLVMLASTRKALFTGDVERNQFVTTMMNGIQNIIILSQGMNNSDNYNEFCRLLFRFRTMVPLDDMATKPGYEDWVHLIADFTLKAFQSWKWSPNTANYLLGFWSRIVESMSYYQQLDEIIVKKLKSITVELVGSYIITNVQSVPTRIEEMLDDPLENEENLVDTLMMLGRIARLQYRESSSTLISIFDPIAIEYQELLNQTSGNMVTTSEQFKEALDIIETKFAWLVYFAAVFIGNRPSFLSSEDLDTVDGEITTKVLQLMQVNQQLLQQDGITFLSPKLDAAFIYFFQQFRKSYINEASAKSVYIQLTKVFGVSDQVQMLNVIMRKILTNLQFWGDNESIIKHTLELFNDLASGYSAIRNLRKIDAIQYLLQNHMNSGLAFFDHHTQNNVHRHHRMLYYQILSKILFAEEVNELEFDAFMKSFEQKLDELAQLDTIEAFRQLPVKRALQDIFRDLRGLIMSMQSRKQYLLFFDWFYPDYMPVVLRGLEAWADDTMVTTTLLKFAAELVHNKNQRLNFDVSSPNGILLFKDASQLLSIYGRHIIDRNILQDDRKYQDKYKGIMICFQILARCLGGKYINFGVFWLYQDSAISDAFNIIFQMMLDIPISDLVNFPKVTKAYFQMMDEFSLEQIKTLPTLGVKPFLYMMEACEQGIQLPDAYIRTHACATLEHIFTFIVEETERYQDPGLVSRRQKRSSTTFIIRRSSSSSNASVNSTSSTSHPHWCLEYIQDNPHIIVSLFITLFGLILFDDNNDQWQLSRPLYVLTLLQRENAMKYTNYVIQHQLPERREFITKALNQLMEGINWTLNKKDRERFSHNALSFKRELNSNQISLTPLSTSKALMYLADS
ncbi:unnamed protein product [Cunninghamella echinulata]